MEGEHTVGETGEEKNIFEEIDRAENKGGNRFDFESFIERYKILITILLLGLILGGVGLFLYKDGMFADSGKVEVIGELTGAQKQDNEIVVEISGAVIKPGVYNIRQGSRIEDLLISSGGLSADADRGWVEKNINRAARVTDGQKIYIPGKSDSQSDVLSASSKGGYQTVSTANSANSDEKVNINNSSLKELDLLPGIGPVYGQNIIDQRPYSNIEELLNRGVLKQSVYDKIKEKITVY